MTNDDVLEKIKEIASDITMYPELDVDEHVLQAGFDSLMMIRFILSVEEEFSIKLNLGQFIELGTLRSVADSIVATSS